MNVSGVAVRCTPEKRHAVCAAFEAMDGVEIHAATDDGRVVVVIDKDNTREAADAYVALHDVDGVINVSLVYAYADEGDIPSLFNQEKSQ
ncbi:chaperone NapD [Craterilacuibacter sp. RT1T]|uniref:chaperone NapD n=1 Tax=Craterilacuibacter sp. RT1T TaxID=2942211 RepID=UPI0020BD62C4|nr:chaperone NapD [Craterilacuibacter sp. RT1T]MCL6263821.1 chaperone NapD [Craterilacuibacter sp. RT1T]